MSMPTIPTTRRPPDWRVSGAVALLLFAAAWGVRGIASRALQVSVAATAGQALGDGVPTAFAGWRLLADAVPQVGTTTTPDQVDPRSPYAEQVVRSYRGADGRVVMLTLAHVAALTPYTKPHLPDDCYPAAGFEIRARHDLRLQALEPPGMTAPLMARYLLAERGTRREAVLYWTRAGNGYTLSPLDLRWQLLRHDGVPDGMLVRVSMLVAGDDDLPATEARLERFLADLLAASPPAVQQALRRT